jgi:hypothetical protein
MKPMVEFIKDPKSTDGRITVRTVPPLPDALTYLIIPQDDGQFSCMFGPEGCWSRRYAPTYEAAQAHATQWVREKMKWKLRYPREACTAALSAVLKRVDANPERLVKYDKHLDRDRPWASHVMGTLCARAKRIWVFGSYARGAVECGDVDMIVDVDISWVDNFHWRQGKNEPREKREGNQHMESYLGAVAASLFGPMRTPIHRGGVQLYSTFFDQGNHEFSFDPGALLRDEAKLVWEPGLDWRAALDSIKPNPNARPFPKKTE